jgi:hypothetical protein
LYAHGGQLRVVDRSDGQRDRRNVRALSMYAEIAASPATPPLMYHNLGLLIAKSAMCCDTAGFKKHTAFSDRRHVRKMNWMTLQVLPSVLRFPWQGIGLKPLLSIGVKFMGRSPNRC